MIGRSSPGDQVRPLRAQGLSIRTISERTGIARSTVADRLAHVRDAMPVRIVGRDGRRYLAVRDPRLDEPDAGPPFPSLGGHGASADPASRELRRLVLLDQLRQARGLLPDVVPLTEHDRLRIALDLAAITRIAGIRDGDVARAHALIRRAVPPSSGHSDTSRKSG